MKFSKLIQIAAVLSVTGVTSLTGGAFAADLTSKQLIACRDEVHFGKHGFSDLPMAAFSVWSGGDKPSGNADWAVKWDGLKANGTCKVGPNNNKVHKVTVINKRQKGGGGGAKNNFYYDRHVAAWRDPDGKICHTCTPENGFPDHGAHDRAHKEHRTKLEKQLQRHINNSLSQGDIDNINAMVANN